MSKIKTIICDDVKELCNNYQICINMLDDFVCVGVAYSAKECVEVVKKQDADLLLIDIQMETEIAGIEAIEKIKTMRPAMKIIVLTSHDNEDYVFQAFLNGADRYLVKKSNIRQMFDEIYNMYKNITEDDSSHDDLDIFKNKVKEMYNNRNSILYLFNSMSRLSASEFDLLKALYMGKSYKDIARERYVEETSVKSMASRILKKMDVKKMKDLVDELRNVRFFEDMRGE